MKHPDFLRALEAGVCRAARKSGTTWVVDTAIKAQILDLFRHTAIKEMANGFRDKEFLDTRRFDKASNVRLVPGGSSVRAGAHIGKNVVIMPPAYVNIGAYVDDDTMIDSHVLVGSCAQIGKSVHLSAAVQVGGVLEPIGHTPVVVEDNCFIGAGVVLTESIIVRERAVVAPGVTLSAAVPIYDIIHQKIYKGEVPPGAVVVPGTKPVTNNPWANGQGLQLGCAVIVKYRDDKTAAAITLENALR